MVDKSDPLKKKVIKYTAPDRVSLSRVPGFKSQKTYPERCPWDLTRKRDIILFLFPPFPLDTTDHSVELHILSDMPELLPAPGDPSAEVAFESQKE